MKQKPVSGNANVKKIAQNCKDWKERNHSRKNRTDFISNHVVVLIHLIHLRHIHAFVHRTQQQKLGRRKDGVVCCFVSKKINAVLWLYRHQLCVISSSLLVEFGATWQGCCCCFCLLYHSVVAPQSVSISVFGCASKETSEVLLVNCFLFHSIDAFGKLSCFYCWSIWFWNKTKFLLLPLAKWR